MSAGLKTQYCANHPDRIGRALCMSCKKVVCQECATQWEGINYCIHCLRRKGGLDRGAAPVLAWLAMGGAIVILFLCGSLAMTWAASLFARLF